MLEVNGLLSLKRNRNVILTAAKDMPKSFMIPDSVGDEYPVCKAKISNH